jgi:hypothetical protein
MNSPLIFVNIGWMVSYKGPKNDPTIGGHGWLKNHDYGHEAWNFLPHKGKLYGYVPRSQRIDLKRLGATAKENRVSGATVVWIARSPRNGHTYIVGWYSDATIHRETDFFIVPRANGQSVKYQIEAAVEGMKLLTPDQRVVRVPTAKVKGNLGQSPVWYGNPEFIELVREYLSADGVVTLTTKVKSAEVPKQPDPEMRKQIELAAVRHAINYYESPEGGNRIVDSVEKDNVGWDLIVTSGDVTLKVEVKGLSGKDVIAELTPNEYKKMISAEHRNMYVIYIVTEAFTSKIKSHVFYYNEEASKGRSHIWNTDDGRMLKVEELTGARLSVY